MFMPWNVMNVVAWTIQIVEILSSSNKIKLWSNVRSRLLTPISHKKLRFAENWSKQVRQVTLKFDKANWYSFNWFVVNGKVRITRTCGYITDERTSTPGAKSCFKDAFTSYTSSFYCDCFVDGCNKAAGVSTNLLLLIATTFAALKFRLNWVALEQPNNQVNGKFRLNFHWRNSRAKSAWIDDFVRTIEYLTLSLDKQQKFRNENK